MTWSDLDTVIADAVIAAQITRFSELSRPWEWKYYSSDGPPDLPDRLIAAGFTPEPAETLLVAEIADLTLHVPPPPGVELRTVVDPQGVEALVSVHVESFGGDHSPIGRTRSLVARRAALASAQGFRYLQVDALPASLPILKRLGFVELATTTPFTHPGRAR